MRAILYIFLSLVVIPAAVAGCSSYAKQMRQTQKYSRQNVQRQENKKADGAVLGADDLSRDDVNYKDVDEIRCHCVHVDKKGNRCTRKAVKGATYCRWHTPKYKF